MISDLRQWDRHFSHNAFILFKSSCTKKNLKTQLVNMPQRQCKMNLHSSRPLRKDQQQPLKFFLKDFIYTGECKQIFRVVINLPAQDVGSFSKNIAIIIKVCFSNNRNCFSNIKIKCISITSFLELYTVGSGNCDKSLILKRVLCTLVSKCNPIFSRLSTYILTKSDSLKTGISLSALFNDSSINVTTAPKDIS